jgi:hypothetical protein
VKKGKFTFKPALAKQEHCFDDIPEDELYPCCLWEYARESRIVREHVQRIMNKKGDFSCSINDSQRSEKVVMQPIVGPNMLMAIAFLNEVVRYAINIWFFHPPLPFPNAWKSLPIDARKKLAYFWPVVSGRKSNKGKALAPPDPIRKSAFGPVTLPIARQFPLQKAINTDDLYLGLFQIKWTFHNNHIIKAFQQWLNTNRPPTSRPYDRRGQDLDHYRAALRQLGIMRLINSDPTQSNAERNKEARRALKHFQEFVNTGNSFQEHPIHWPKGWE